MTFNRFHLIEDLLSPKCFQKLIAEDESLQAIQVSCQLTYPVYNISAAATLNISRQYYGNMNRRIINEYNYD